MHHLPFFLVLHDFEQGLGTFDGRTTDLPAFRRGIGTEFELGEEGRGVVVLILRPTLKRMVVAFVAVEADGEEQLCRRFHDGIGSAQDLEVRRRRILAVRPRRGDDAPSELIVGSVLGDLRANPVTKRHRPLGSQVFSIDHQEVGPLVRPVVHIFRTSDQPIDYLLAFDFRGAIIVQELADLFGGRG